MKKLLLGMFLLVACTLFMGASDWKKCNTELVMANTFNTLVIYDVKWLDHDIEKYKGFGIGRCGGGIEPYAMSYMGEDFRLCPGRHIATWWLSDVPGVYNQYEFIVTKEMTQIVLTPDKMIVGGI